MLFFIGLFIVLFSVGFGYGAHGGNMGVLWQPYEFIIIIGAAIGAFIIANPKHIIKGVMGGFKLTIKSKFHSKADYIELLSFMYNILKIMKTKGMLELESHIENPYESELFTQFPGFVKDHHAVDFFCDYLRVLTMGVEDPMQVEDLMDAELEVHHHEGETVAGSINTMGDGMPALGIVAAVLGVITTMGSITEPPEILGGLIGAALVGTFTGVLLAYGLVGPIGGFLTKYFHEEGQYFLAMKAAIIAVMKGCAPILAIEFARKAIPSHARPSFQEVEEALAAF